MSFMKENLESTVNRKRLSLSASILLSVFGGLVVLSVLVALMLTNRWLPVTKTAEAEPSSNREQNQDAAAPELARAVDLETFSAEERSADSAIVISQYSTLKFEDDNAAVETLQQQLMKLGYLDHDIPSTSYNVSIVEAVKLFQRSSDVDETGIADAELQELLYQPNAQTYRLKLSDSGSDVENLQQRLREMGYYQEKISGYFGPKTEEAVMLFQSCNEMRINGTVTHEDWELIYSDEAVESANKPTPTPTSAPTPERTAAPAKTASPTKKPSATSAGNDKAKATATPKPTKTPKPDATAKPDATPKPDATVKPEATSKPSSGGDSKSYASGVDGLLACASDQLGKPYVWSNKGPDSFDCSGFVYYCLTKAGVSVSRLSSKSYAANSKWEEIKSMDDLKKGDLLFFCNDSSSTVSHTGIYIGGSKFTHASSSAGKVLTSSFSAYWKRNFVCARRVF